MPLHRSILPLLLLLAGCTLIWTLAASVRMYQRSQVDLYQVAQSIGLTTKPMITSAEGVLDEGTLRRKEEITLMTFNVRYDNVRAPKYPNPPGPDQTLPTQLYGEYSWAARRFAVSDIAIFHNPDIVVFQEVLHGQLLDLAHLLGDDYQWIGVGRNDGKTAGEAVPVFFKRNKFLLIPEKEGGVGETGYEHFWLSPTPSVVASVGWDAALTRMCTHVGLKLRPTPGLVVSADPSLRAPIHVFSTHYDHQGVVARAKSSELILARANAAQKSARKLTGQEPLVILAGDLNSPRDEIGWKNLVGGHHGVPAQGGSAADALSFYDLQLASRTRFGLPYPSNYSDTIEVPRGKDKGAAARQDSSTGGGILSTNFGPSASFTDWGSKRDRSAAEDRIDFLFVGDNQPVIADGGESRKGEGWRVKTVGVLSSWSAVEGGIRASDHRPVMARLRWEDGRR